MKSTLICMLLLLTGCFDDSGSIVVAPSIIGTWQYAYSANPSCTETHIYKIDGSFESTSFEEIKTGTYNITRILPDGRKEVLIIISDNNQLLDCTGTNTGTGTATYVIAITSTTLSYYIDSSSDLPVKVFNRL